MALFLLAGVWGVRGQSARPGVGAMPYADSGGTGVAFRVWAPNATSVGVKGQFNGWSTAALVKEGATGYWSGDVAGARAGQEYKYVINGGSDRRDPRGRRLVNSAGNSIVYDAGAFDWQGVAASPPWMNDLVVYEMHPGTYNAESWVPSTFDACIEKLDHLADLGFSAVQVMPVAEFAGDTSWGYNPADPYAIESALGGPDAFKRFVKACHERGLAVLVDVVHNHYGPSDLSLWQFDGWSQNGRGGIYFYNDDKASTMWGDTRPDYGRGEVREFIHQNIRMYLEEYRVDGFRWDSVFSILYANGGSTHLPDAEAMLRDINWMIATQYPGRIRIAEDRAFDFNMNFDGVWDTAFVDHLQWQVTRGSDAERNMGWLGDRIGGSHARVIYSESHDTCGDLNSEVRLVRSIDGSNPWSIWARKRQLLAQGIVLTAAGVPMVFQGQEMNEDWTFSSSTALRWSLTNTWSGIVAAHRDLIHARRNLNGGTQGLKGTGVDVHHKDDGNKVIAYVRWDAGGGADDVVVVANFAVAAWTNRDYYIEFPSAGTWYAHVNTDSTNYSADFGGIGDAQVVASGTPPRAAVNMGMYSVQIFSKTAPPQAGQFVLEPAAPTGCVAVAFTYAPGGGPLSGATQVVAGTGINDWQSPQDVPLTNNGSGVWSGSFTIPFETEVLDVVFHDGAESGRVYDNNLGRDWHVEVDGCADLPASVALSPASPQGCVPVAVTYTERSGPLAGADQITLFIGRNDWQDIQEVALVEHVAGVWTGLYAIASDTWQLDYVFHNAAEGTNRVWDGNSGADWLTYVSSCIDSLEPYVAITNPAGDLVVSNEIALLDIRGETGPGIEGLLTWSNQLSGASGQMPADATWTVLYIALEEGVNLIRVTSTNNPVNPNRDSWDAPGLDPYTNGNSWVDSMNGGRGGGGGWELSGGANAGHYLARSLVDADLNAGTHGWGLWAHTDGLASAVRPLAVRLGLDDILRVRFENNYIDTDASVGIGLQNRFGQNLFEFLFIGGGTNYVINDDATSRATGLPFTDQGLDLEFQLTTPTTYRFVAGGQTFTGTLAESSESVVSQFRSWNYMAGGGGDNNLYLADLQVTGPTQLQSGVFQDEIAVTRQPGPFSDADRDGFLTWEEDFAGTDPNDAGSRLADIGWLPNGRASYIEIPSSSPGRWYDLFFRTSLLSGAWGHYGVPRQGSGGSIWLDFTNTLGEAYYRTGVYEP